MIIALALEEAGQPKQTPGKRMCLLTTKPLCFGQAKILATDEIKTGQEILNHVRPSSSPDNFWMLNRL
jgi:hypothetical protein